MPLESPLGQEPRRLNSATYARVLYRMDYYNGPYAGLPLKSFQNIVQNGPVGGVMRSPRSAQAAPPSRKLCWLPVCIRIQCKGWI